ncbi:protein PLANT CADMIUM RESISTANCE 3-like [Asterias rubens]|uniref:protein PLANT CADMIUM RESISTANCE 3-like n=1 Tax=Asterias rubens TaxID=7604 RepID=UPI0014551B39|nr:protein PLANT CADMIUM RESISTANCE 3-like [Asterias rubens]
MGEWDAGLFGCFDNIGLCLITYVVPCYIAGKLAEQNGESCMMYGVFSVLGCVGLWSMTKIRGMTRAAKGIDGDYTNDLLMIWCCTLCALVQEAQQWGLHPKSAMGESMARE